MTELIGKIVKTDFNNKMGSYLKGRTLWCASTCSESLIVPNESTERLRSQILDLSIDALKSEKTRSIKLIATRTLVRYARKINKEVL